MLSHDADLARRSKDIEQLQKHCDAVQQLQQAAAAGQAGALPPHWSSLVRDILARVKHTLEAAEQALS